MEYADGELQDIWPDLQAIAAPARERRRLNPAIFKELILALCSRAPLSVRDLSLLLDRTEPYIGDAIRPLVASGQIQFLFPEQPKHPRQKYVVGAPARASGEPASASSSEPTPTPRATPSQTPAATPTETPRATPAAPPSETPRATPSAPSAASHAAPVPATPLSPESSAKSADAVREMLQRQRALMERARAAQPPTATTQAALNPAGEAPGGWGTPGLSMLASLVIGIILALVAVQRWPYYAAVAAIAFAVIHVQSGSRQYFLYLTQQSMRASGPRSNDPAIFVAAKAAFTFIEIAAVVLIVALIRKMIS